MEKKIDLLLKEIQRIKKSISVMEDELKRIKDIGYPTKMSIELTDVWKQVIDILKKELIEISFNTWIKDIEPVAIDGNYFYISVVNAFNQNIVEGRYAKLIQTALKFITDRDYIVKVLVKEIDDEANVHESIENKQDTIKPKYTFDNIVVGEHNKMAHKSAFEFVNNFYQKPRIIYFYGKAGLGKTHILKATKNYILEHYPSGKVKYMITEDFTNKLIESIFDNSNENFINEIINNDVLFLDNFQDIKGKEHTQKEIIKIINAMVCEGKSVIIGCTKSPNNLFMFEEKIDSLFELEEVFEITEPDIDVGVKMLKKKMENENIELKEEILKFIASNFNSDVRELINALNRIISYNRLTDEKIDFDKSVKILTN